MRIHQAQRPLPAIRRRVGPRRDEKDIDVDIAIGALWGVGIQHFLMHGLRPEEDMDRMVDRLFEWFGNVPSVKKDAQD